MSKKTPLEETFNLPSIEELNEELTNDKITQFENDKDHNEDFESEEDDFKDELDIPDGETISKDEAIELYNQTKQKLLSLENESSKKLKNYDKDVTGIHTTAIDNFEKLMLAALNMEAAHGSKYLMAATKLLDIALSSKNSMMDKQIELLKLQLRKEKQDFDMNQSKNSGVVLPRSDVEDDDPESEEEEVEGTYDRNEILREFSDRNNNEDE